MQQTAHIQFRDIVETPSLRRLVEKNITKLEKFFPRIIGCQVLVEAPARHRRKGNPYHVRVDLSLPGKELVVDPHPQKGDLQKNLYVALTHTFNVARRTLQDYVKRRRTVHRVPA